MADPVLVFGVGAAKSGTSWLYDYLRGHPDCHLRSIKELHFFDARDFGNRDWYLRDLSRKADVLERRIVEQADAAPTGDILRLAELRHYLRVLENGGTDGYLAFLFEERDDERVVGEITPGYSLLSEATLREMAGLHADVRFVFVMRDPIERLWRHVRMVAERRAQGAGHGQTRRVLDLALLGRERHITDRGDYAATVRRLKAAVAPDKLFLATCEDLSEPEGLARLCRFLGIAAVPCGQAAPEQSAAADDMTESQLQRAMACLKPQYDFVASDLGALPPAWQASLARM